LLHITTALKATLGKSSKGKEKKTKERSQFLKWIVETFEGLPMYVNKKDISLSNLVLGEKSSEDLLGEFAADLALFINCGVESIKTESEHGNFSTVPPLKTGK
jgi:hypothetical protein